ncbi:MAG: ATPase, T2SS/T4P/T4SS family [Candidatus Aminicenantes bacterium]
MPSIDPDLLAKDFLPYSFCRKNLVVPVKKNDSVAFIISNPFDLPLLDALQKVIGHKKPLDLKLSSPDRIGNFLNRIQHIDFSSDSMKSKVYYGKSKIPVHKPGDDYVSTKREIRLTSKQDKSFQKNEKLSSIINLTNQVLTSAINQRASDIHIEPKENKAFVRYRIDGELQDSFFIHPDTCKGLISRLKVLANMNIAETRRPQDGAIEAIWDKRKIKMRLTTVGTPHGESLIIRIFDPTVSVISLSDLGMSQKQMELMKEMIISNRGMILVVGPTGSGKTTTLYSLLHSINTKSRSVISIEDPVEYSIPDANQQEVNIKIGLTFESLLKSAVRQDPDILFIGEIRDKYSAKMAVEAASTGHLTLSTLHTLNATTAIFRLERFGLSRTILAEALLGIVAQRLVKTLCPYCKVTEDITDEDSKILSRFTSDIPPQAGYPAGCPKCDHSGYLGRCGIYEILDCDADIIDRVRKGHTISAIRSHLTEKNIPLLYHQALEKIDQKILSVEEANKKILSEEDLPRIPSVHMEKTSSPKKDKISSSSLDQDGKRILVVEDDEDMKNLISRFLKSKNYELYYAQDGIEALLEIGKTQFDLILSDINMPNLDGMKLLEMLTQKAIKTPVILITSRTAEQDEIKGLSLGAVDYIKKPLSKDMLLLRVQRVLGGSVS